MKKPEKREGALLFILLVVTGALTLWAALSNGSVFVVLPVCGYVLFGMLLFLFWRPPEPLLRHFGREEIRNAVLAVLALTLLSAALLLICAEAPHIDNTLDGVNLLRISLLAGAPFGVMFWLKLSRVFDKRNIVMLKSFLIAFALAAAAGTSQINRVAGAREGVPIQTDILGKEKPDGGITSFLTASEPRGYIFVPYGEDEERLVPPKGVWNALYRGGEVRLSVIAGRLGYPYIAAFNGRPLR